MAATVGLRQQKSVENVQDRANDREPNTVVALVGN